MTSIQTLTRSTLWAVALTVTLTSAACGDEQGHLWRHGQSEPTVGEAGGSAFPPASQLIRVTPTGDEGALGASSGTATDAPEAGPVEAETPIVKVVRVQEHGPSDRPVALTLLFSEPMETFDGVQRLSEQRLLTLAPAFEGTAIWTNASTLRVAVDGQLPIATAYALASTHALKSAAGAALATPWSYRFETTRPRVSSGPWGSFRYPARREPDGSVSVHFNVPVTAAALKRALTVTRATGRADLEAGRGVRAPVTVKTVAPAYGAAVGYAITPKDGFGVNQWLRFQVDARIAAGGDLGMSKDWSAVVRGPEPLAVNYVDCGDYRCTPDDTWRVVFNNRLDAKRAQRCVSVDGKRIRKPRVANTTLTFDPPRGVAINTSYGVTINTDCVDIYGTRMATPKALELEVLDHTADLGMVTGNGYLDPPQAGGRLAIPITARHTGPITVAKRRITRADLPTFLASQLEGWGGWSLEPVGDKAKVTTLRPADSPRETQSLAVRIDDVLGDDGRGVVHLEVTGTNEGAYDGPPKRIALVQVTDTGLTVKGGPTSALIWTTSLRDGRPQPNVAVELLDASGETLWSGVSDAHGLATAPGFATFGAKTPRVLVASAGGGDLALLDLKDWSTNIEPYRYGLPFSWDAGGGKVRGFVFTERGVYRAGESVHVKGYLRLDADRALAALPNADVEVRVSDPEGEIVLTRSMTLGPIGDLDLEIPLDGHAALGSYEVTVAATGELEGSATGRFRVEAYRANRFEVAVRDTTPATEAVPGELSATVRGRYLYGAPMPGQTVRWWAHLGDASFSPKGFDGYRFAKVRDQRWWEPAEQSTRTLGQGEGVLDDEGELALKLDLSEVDRGAGAGRVLVEAEVVDVDEQVVAGRTSMRLHPGDFYLGISNGSSVAAAGAPLSRDVVAVTPGGEQLGGVAVDVTLSRRSWRSVQRKAAGGGTTWTSEPVDEEIARKQVTTVANAPVSVSLEPPRSGYYVIEVAAKDDGGRLIRAGREFWAWGGGTPDWAKADDERLPLILDKERYSVGETAKVLVQSPFREAHALVTVERHGVLWQHAVAVEGAAPLLEIPITEEMQPNAFISVALVRGRVKAERGTTGVVDAGKPAFKMGYTTFDVDLADKRLTVAIEPESSSYRPGDEVQAVVRLADHEGRPRSGQVTFMAVDEGVLSLTGYRTPDPIAAFYKKKGIAIVTSENRHRLWASISPTDEGMKSDWGGGGDEGGEATSYRSAFATTAAFLPNVVVGDDGVADVRFRLPDNLGAFRLMAVAATADSRFGTAETRIEVNKPLLVRPGLPRFLATGDLFEARALIQALDGQAGQVVVELDASGPVELLGEARTEVALAAGEVRAVSFLARATGVGEATFGFQAQRGDAAETRDAVQVTIPVQVPSAHKQVTVTGALHDADATTRRIDVPDWVHPEVGGATIELAPTALGELLPGLHYLIKYPYGCVEQTTGGTLPLVALRQLLGEFSLPGVRAADVATRAQAGVDRLRTMQTYEGGLAYWPGESSPHPWGSVYGGLAMVQAAKLDGVEVPEKSLKSLLGYLRKILRQETESPYEEWYGDMRPVEPFAAWVLALAGDPEPAYHARLYEGRDTLPSFAKGLLALAIAEAGGDRAHVDGLVSEMLTDVVVTGDQAMLKRTGGRYYHATMDSDVRSTALALMAVLKTRPDDAVVDQLAKGLLAARRGGRWINTQDNAFAILALADYFTAREDAGESYLATVRLDGEVWLQERLEGGRLMTRSAHIPMATLLKHQGHALTITRDGSDAPLYYTLRFEYAEREPTTAPVASGFQIDRRYTYAEGDRAGEAVSTLAPGDLVKVELEISTSEDRRYVAIEDPLPAGLEPVNTSFASTSSRLGVQTEQSWRQRRVFSHVEQHDDHIRVFANDMPDGRHTHVYLARATTVGTFAAGAASVHEMYAPGTFGQSAARTVVIQ